MLASQSSRRQALLAQLGLRFEVDSSGIEEYVDAALPPAALVQKLALAKARVVAARHPGALVIAADTLGFLRGRIIGKPGTPEEARRMLTLLSGKVHRVVTGLAIVDSRTDRSLSRAVATRVWLKSLAPADIDRYVASGEPLDKAGGYAIQGLGAVLVAKIEGDYYNVVGLPLQALADMLADFGVRVL